MIWQNSFGIDKCFFDAYYKNQYEAVAYKLINVVKFRGLKE